MYRWLTNTAIVRDADEVDIYLGLLHTDLVGEHGYSGNSSRYAVSGEGEGRTYVREIGRNFGLAPSSNDHGECEAVVSLNCDANWIYPHGGLTGHGWNFLRPDKLIVPSGTEGGGWHSHDIMSDGRCADGSPDYVGPHPFYCAEWMSPLNYARIAQRLRCANPHWTATQSCLETLPPFSNVINAFTGVPPTADPRLQEVTTASRAIGPPVGSLAAQPQPE